MIGHDTWKNVTTLPVISPSTSAGMETLIKATYSNQDVPQMIQSAMRGTGTNRFNYTVTKTPGPETVMSTSFVSLPASSLSLSSYISRSAGCKYRVKADYMHDVAAGFQDIIEAHLFGHATEQHDNTNIVSENAGSSDTTSINNTSTSTNVTMAVIDFPHGSIVFLNTTSPNYLLIDHANATVAVWTESVNASMVATKTNSRHFLDTLNTALPWIEACGLLAIVWEIGKFVHVNISARRRRIRPAAAEEPQ